MMNKIYDTDGLTNILSEKPLVNEIVTIDEAKAFARINDTNLEEFDLQNDAILTGLIQASIEYFENFTGRFLTPRTVETKYSLKSSLSYARIELPYVDVDINSIKYIDNDSVEYEITEFSIDKTRGIVEYYDTGTPTNLKLFDNLIINYDTSMFTDESEGVGEVNDDIKTALKQHITMTYENRQSVTEENMNLVPHSATETYDRYKKRKK